MSGAASPPGPAPAPTRSGEEGTAPVSPHSAISRWDTEVDRRAAEIIGDCELSHLEDLASDWENANTCAADGH